MHPGDSRKNYSKKYKRPMRRRRRYGIRWKHLLLTLLYAAIFCFGAFHLTKYALRVRETARTNAQLEQLHAAADLDSAPQTAASEGSIAPESTEEPAAEIAHHYIGSSILPSAEELHRQNPDLIAWLNLPGVINLPVVYRDNEYYLTHDFYGRESESGTLFLDASHPLDARTQYMVLHGHAMYDGSMFGYLTRFRNASYIAEHPYLTFTTLYEQENYEIIGVLFVSEAEMLSVVQLGSPRFESEAAFRDFISGLRAKALHFTADEISPKDTLLALSTCWQDGRIVVYYKRVESIPA